MLHPRLLFFLAGMIVAWAARPPAFADYMVEVKPVLTRHCVPCHGADQQKGGLRLDTVARALQGGDGGPAILPGNPGSSLLVATVRGTHAALPRMPYKKSPLPPEDIDRIVAWIRSGARAPEAEPPGRYVHWAFEPPSRPSLPVDPTSARSRHPIDAFVRERLRKSALEPSPEADRVTLLRRVHLDLTGLPPSPEAVRDFLSDASPGAYERRVDELLRSPHYGERWARWWLDAARYADSNGYSIDAPRSLWPWRDWVIRAFNDNKPFDGFVVEQLAGDLLPDASLAQRVATGFHRNTQINQEGGIDPEQFRIDSVIDRVNTTGTVLLGLTVSCAQCHDHKFDPISQKDYFQLFAFFNDQDEPSLDVPSPAQQAARADHDEAIRDLERQIARARSDEEEPRKQLETRLARLRKSRPQVDTTLVLQERREPRASYVFIKGDFTRRGADVQPATPAALHPSRFEPGRRPSRLDFARWLIDPANPLTARVLVNRVWQHYFGRGIVETENDFGSQGSLPSHPELLDWLATEFVSQGWDFRNLHRLIVLSDTYRQSSRFRQDLAAADPDNRLLGRQNRLRLDAEVIRDVALVASGRLDPTVGGPGVFPPQPGGVMDLGQSRREWKTSDGTARYRRGLYTFFWRATPHPALAVFDAPDAFSACTRRLRSNTPLQALTLLNDAAYADLARALAERIVREVPAERRLDHAFELCLARSPAPEERQRLLRLFLDEEHDHGLAAAWQTTARVLLNLDETITRE